LSEGRGGEQGGGGRCEEDRLHFLFSLAVSTRMGIRGGRLLSGRD
jgi:hypothetical protein